MASKLLGKIFQHKNNRWGYFAVGFSTAVYTAIEYNNHVFSTDVELDEKQNVGKCGWGCALFRGVFISATAGVVWPVFWPVEIGSKVVYSLKN